MIPRATYRLQLHAGFTLHDAAALVDYLAALGVSHVYTSPILAAAPGSSHGYDVVDPTRVDEGRGGEAGRRALVEALRAHGLGWVLDIVPNHQCIASAENRWWWDVLENGPASAWAHAFDVDWGTTGPEDVVLLPVLGDAYGRVLERGELRLERRGADVVVRYFEHAFPLGPASVGRLLHAVATATGDPRLGFAADALGDLPTGRDAASRRRRHRDRLVLRGLLEGWFAADPDLAARLDHHLDAVSRDPDALHAVLEAQAYRLASWRTSRRELGFRRFFDITSLVGLRVEDPNVFEAVHALPLAWVAAGEVDGLRVDHPDGLRDPEGYARRLRARAGEGTWIVLEKILGPGETLPPWPVDGTTGYDFLTLVDQAFVDPAGQAPLAALWAELGGAPSFAEEARRCKRVVLGDTLGGELNRLVALLGRVCAARPRHRDHTADDLRVGLREVLVAFPVYRTYVTPDRPASEADRAVIRRAVEEARAARPDLDPELFDLLHDVLVGRETGEAEDAFRAAFQQVTGPVTAKGVEDTAFYTWVPLLALDEVGGDPGTFGRTADEVHAFLAGAAARGARSVLATATHDTKRGEDARARLLVLSSMAADWADWVRSVLARWPAPDGPDGIECLLILQSLVGAWPVGPDRFLPFVEKALREGKHHGGWSRPDTGYEAAVLDHVRRLLDDPAFVREVEGWVARVEPAARVLSLARTVIKLAGPGVPDLYQGTELWDHALVDPDNRRPVDFPRRRRLLAELDRLDPAAILARADEGLPKLWTIRQGLRVRRDHPAAMAGNYRPLDTDPRVLAFARGDDEVVAVVPLRPVDPPRDARIVLPGRYRDVLGGGVAAGETTTGALWARFPVALLVREDG